MARKKKSEVLQKTSDLEERKTTRSVAVTIDAEDVAEHSKRLCGVLSQIDNVKAEKKAACSDANASLKELNTRAHELAESIRNGTENRDVECIESFDFRTGTVTCKRIDTGEIIDERAINAEERQAALDLDAMPLAGDGVSNDVNATQMGL